MKIKTLEDLKQIKERYLEKSKNLKKKIVICAGTGCVANGSLKVYEELVKLIKSKGLNIAVELKHEDDNNYDVLMGRSGCQGFCQMGPLVTIDPDGILYTRVTPNDAEDIVNAMVNNDIVERLLYRHPKTGEPLKGKKEIPFYAKQKRVVLNNCGSIDAFSLEEYIANDGYLAAYKAIKEMDSDKIIDEVKRSGLKGRGGGGFPTGLKWEFAKKEVSDKKYIICNGDEGDPGAFMDRSLMEGNPHAVIEGMMIAAKAIGANEGYIYVRIEYPLAIERLNNAINIAREAGLLGENIFDSNFSFDVHVMAGAGAFVCGEETALIKSIEGNRGMPTPKPPFPAQKGLWGYPTVINNVETLATVPLVLTKGADFFANIGTETSKGTKTFALTGNVANTGLIEVPFGITLREIIDEIGGGVIDEDGNNVGVDFKAVQIGGPSGGCLTKEMIDMPLDYDNLKKIGAMVGSGGLVVMNNNNCMVNIAKFFMSFTQNESCGKCTPCREGTKQILKILEKISKGEGELKDLEILEELAETVKTTSLCGLGKTAPNPVLSTLKYFRDEYVEHITHKVCKTKNCPDLSKPEINRELCKGCSLCAKVCPVGAISGVIKQPFTIDQDKCINCKACIEACKFKAIA